MSLIGPASPPVGPSTTKKKRPADAAGMQELIPESKKAYDAEMRRDFITARQLHSAAANLWLAFAGTVSLTSSASRLAGRAGELRAKLHNERVAYINSVVQPAAGGVLLYETMAMHASTDMLARGLNAEVARLADFDSSPEETWARMPLNMQEHQMPGVHVPSLGLYTPTLPVGHPPREFDLTRSVKTLRMGRVCHCVITLADTLTKQTLLILESWSAVSEKYGSLITQALVYRAAEYPVPAYRIFPLGEAPTPIGPAVSLRTYDLVGQRAKDDTVDRKKTFMPNWWQNPRRTTWGGRQFVRKQLPLGDDKGMFRSEGLYEFQNSWPKPGSKTGKREDDAQATKLVWYEAKRFANHDFKVFAVHGLDPAFREYMFATLMMRVAIERCGATPGADQNVNMGAELAKDLGKEGVGLAFSIALGLLGAG